MSLDQVCNEIEKAAESFNFEYVSGGYFRDKTVPKGTPAVMFHGNAALRELVRHIIEKVRGSIVNDPRFDDEINRKLERARQPTPEIDKIFKSSELPTSASGLAGVITQLLDSGCVVNQRMIRLLCNIAVEQENIINRIAE